MSVSIRDINEADIKQIGFWYKTVSNRFFTIDNLAILSNTEIIQKINNPYSGIKAIDLDDKIVGLLKIFLVNLEAKFLEFYISIDEASLKSEILNEIIVSAISDLFAKNEIDRIRTTLLDTEIQLKDSIEKMGFKHEGVLKSHVFLKSRYHDLHSLSCLRTEFNA